MATDRRVLVAAGVGSDRSSAYPVGSINRIDVHIYFVQAGGEARIVTSMDNTNFAPFAGLPAYTSSIAVGLDVAEATYIAVEYTNATEIKAMVGEYEVDKK